MKLGVELAASSGTPHQQKASRQPGKQPTERAAREGQQQALGQQLPDEAEASRSQRESHRHLLPPLDSPRQQQIGDVGAGDEQRQPDHNQHDSQRLLVRLAQVDFSLPARQRAQTRQIARPGIGRAAIRRRGFPARLRALLKNPFEFGARLFQANSRLHPSHHPQPPIPGLSSFRLALTIWIEARR